MIHDDLDLSCVLGPRARIRFMPGVGVEVAGRMFASSGAARQRFAWAMATLRLNRADLGTVDRWAIRLDLLAARKPLLQAEQQLAAVRSQRYAAAIDLDQALGGGIAATAPTPIASH